MMKVLRWITGDSRRRFFIGLLVAALVFLCVRSRMSLAHVLVASWDAFALSVLTMVWLTIILTPQCDLRGRAKRQDLGRFIIFGFVVAAACAALFAVAFLIRVHHEEMQRAVTSYIFLALGTVTLSWALLHTVFSLHYAHVFYGDSDDDNQRSHVGGLDFPHLSKPDYLDFAYFSFVVGMTCQVSDVQVTSRKMRRLTLLHGVLSFAYNTVILALLINTVSSLL